MSVGALASQRALIPNTGAPQTSSNVLTVHQRIWPAVANDPSNTPILPVNTAVMVDTRGVWKSEGGNVDDGTPLLIDGHTLTDWGYGGYWLIDPTAADPVKCWATLIGPHTFTLGPRSAVIRVIYCAANWLAQADSNSAQNITYWGTAFPTVPGTDFPQASNSFAKGYGFLNSQIQNNGFSLNVDPAPATSAVIITAPGVSPGATSDIRAEPNLVDGFGQGQDWCPSGALAKNGFDPVFNLRQTPFVNRIDYEQLSQYTVPNGTHIDLSSNGPWYSFNSGRNLTTWPLDYQTPFTANTSNGSKSLTNVSSVLSINQGTPISGPGIPPGTVVSDINGSAPWVVTMSQAATATASGVTVTPTAAASATIGPYADDQWFNVTSSRSNGDEDEGPGSDLVLSGTTIGVGAKGGWNFRYQPFAAGNANMKTATFATIDLATVGLDTRFAVWWEVQRGVCATANGVPWLLDTQPSGGSWGATIPGQLTLQAGAGTWAVGTTYARQKMVVGPTTGKYYLSLVNGNVGNNPDTSGGGIGDPNWLQCTWQPYGIPRDASGNPATPGGSFVRVWYDFVGNGQPVCVSQNLVDNAGLAISIPGTATYDPATGNVIESQPGAGKIYGIQGRANLGVLSASVGIGDTTIAVPNQIVSAVTPNFANQLGGGSGLIWDRAHGTWDFIRWTGFGGSGFTGVSGITQPHGAGSHIHGFIEPMQNSPGTNQAAGRAGNNTNTAPSGLALPEMIREWNLLMASAVANDGVTPNIGDLSIPFSTWV